ncbi:FtsW/RodA/SpoVE family cell cycle protein [Sediminicola luteus]|uniref:Probable peptidoglycan glycosyltransferase FtsW n=1 Tax=Sediminicola luteus TaxID=319238 RepID=A0A2A4G3Y3_9FLAO|nr:FtsW/RodA/SpoVE family cell cycle protein [Sediminicola luteus]PCE63387.1 cell division protein FtsW [Sediminicola luteus]
MKKYLADIQGDKAIWGVVTLLAFFSFLPVYSTGSSLLAGSGTIFGYIIKHIFLLILGFGIIYAVHRVPTHYFKGLSIIAMPVIILLLAYTLAQGKVMDGANASRWMQVPFVGLKFQTSNLAAVVLMVYVARYLSKIKDRKVSFQESILPLWAPVFLVVALIFPANFSTAAIIFSMVLTLCFIGGYPIKYLLGIVATGVIGAALFIMTTKAFPDLMPTRVDTWTARIERFISPSEDGLNEDYQSQRAKMAIASGGVFGRGAGKSVMKNTLPQSSSDFMYAIIIEEYGMLGGLALLFFYLLFLFRVVVVANGATTIFAKLLAIGVGIPIVFQAFINMAVATGLFPVTGQTLPLISTGGTSIWMTCLAVGIILSASVKKDTEEEKAVKTTKKEEEPNPLEVLSGQL